MSQYAVDAATITEAYTAAAALTVGMPDAPPDSAELAEITAQLCGHVELLMLEVKAAARELGEDSVEALTVKWLIVRAKKALQEGPGQTIQSAAVHAEELAAVCAALLAHYRARQPEHGVYCCAWCRRLAQGTEVIPCANQRATAHGKELWACPKCCTSCGLIPASAAPAGEK